MNSYVRPWMRYFEMQGCSDRSEYWTFTTVNLIIAIILNGIAFFGGAHPMMIGLAPIAMTAYSHPMSAGIAAVLSTLFSVAAFIPTIAVTARRLHDTDRSAWWMIVSFLPLVGPLIMMFMLLQPTNLSSRYLR